jgi:uncharacterized protein YndB with AHSA1/START domain
MRMAKRNEVTWAIDEARHPLGRMVDRRTMRYERVYPVPVERVWEAISDEKQLGAWYIPLPAELDPTVGGHFWFGDEADTVMSGVVIDLDPGRRIVLAFRNGTGASFTVAPAGGGTSLTYTHWLHPSFELPQDGENEWTCQWNYQPGGPGTYQPALAACWHGSLCALDHHLGGQWPEGREREANPAPFPVELFPRYRDLIVTTLPDW